MVRDWLSIIGEILLVIIGIPFIVIGALLIGILYFLFVIKEFILTIIFNK